MKSSVIRLGGSQIRDLIDVATAMIEIVPKTENEFLASLNDFKSSLEFAAPESIPFWWGEIAEFLQEAFPDLSDLEGWQQSAIDIWVNKEREDSLVKELYTDYIGLMNLTKEYPDNYKYSVERRNLTAKCLANPKAVADLVFSDRSNRIDSVEFQDRNITFCLRKELIFTLSQDDCRTCLMSENPQWGKFMRKFIIPRMRVLDIEIQSTINWYITVHGL